MNDSADMKLAAATLDAAVDSLEAAIGPILARMKSLETAGTDANSFREDRAKLAGQLDDMAAQAQEASQKADAAAAEARAAAEQLAAREADFTAREAEFKRLAAESEAELERVMGVVRTVMEG